ncbi:tandem-95 repeat protein [Cohnella endophytica]|uniref:Tandem-95 repeat protein n=1 Tax=Cohnella endophytica TaxID=2419778 RepID=A0A494XAT9_9BACL|nr:S-layer homology domain-containing protein [Cohnella endophytica]RKP47875.1 tandem-95 repeat protein [Cohnella endophytica]
MNKKWSKALSTAIILTAVTNPSLVSAETIKVPYRTTFVDMEQISEEKKAAIVEAARQGLLTGDAKGMFRPVDELTRQELAVLLARSLQLDTQAAPSNTRLEAGTGVWAVPYIDAVRKAGLMLGDGKGNFRPKDPVSREELAAIFVRAVNGEGSRGGNAVVVNDIGNTSAWAKDMVSAAVRLGLIDAQQDGLFQPKAIVQRQDIAAFLLNIFQSKEQQATITRVDGDVVIIDNKPFLITPALKRLIGDNNADVLAGAVLIFKSKNRSLSELEELEIVQSGSSDKPAVLDLSGTSFGGVLRVSGNHVTIKGDGNTRIERLEPKDNASNLQLSGVIVGTLVLSNNVAPSDIIRNYYKLMAQIGQVIGGKKETPAPTAPVTNVPTPVNHAPVVNLGWSVSPMTMGTDGTLDLTGLFTDEDGDTLSYTITALDSSIATVASGGTTSTPTIHPVASGTATFTVDVSDGQGGTASTTISVTVNPAPVINHAPVKNNAWAAPSFTVGTDGTLDLTGLFTDEDGDTLSYTITALDSSIATVASGGTTSTPTIHPVASGTATFTVAVSDGKAGGTATTTISVTVNPAPVINHAPVKNNAWTATSFTVGTDGTLDLTGLFTDEDGDTLSYTITALDSSIATVASGGTTSTPTIHPVASGTATFTVAVSDGKAGGTATTTISVTVNPAPVINHAPVKNNAWTATSFTVGTDGTLDLTGLFTDEDGDTLSYTITALSSSIATVASGGTTGTPTIHPVASGTATFRVDVSDGKVGGTATTTITVTVNPAPVINHAPVKNNAWTATSFTVGTDGTLDLTGLFTDEDGDTLSYTITALDSSIATVASGGITSTPTIHPVASGTASFTVAVSDGQGGTASTTIQIAINPAPQVSNNPPEVVAAIQTQLLSPGYTNARTYDLSQLFEDPDGDAMTFTAVVSDTSAAQATINGNEFTLSPGTAGHTGAVTVTITATDSNGGSATYNLSVLSVQLVDKGFVEVNTKVGVPSLTYDVKSQFPGQTNFNVYFATPDQTLTGPTSLSGTKWTSTPMNGDYWIVGADNKAVLLRVTVNAQVSGESYFSQYIDGGGYSKAIQIRNAYFGTGQKFAGYSIDVYHYDPITTSITSVSTSIFNIPVQNIQDINYINVIDRAFYEFFDVINTPYYNLELNLNVQGKKLIAIVLKHNGTVIDVLGDSTSHDDFLPNGGTIIRKAAIYSGSAKFSETGEWNVYPKGTYQYFNQQTP